MKYLTSMMKLDHTHIGPAVSPGSRSTVSPWTNGDVAEKPTGGFLHEHRDINHGSESIHTRLAGIETAFNTRLDGLEAMLRKLLEGDQSNRLQEGLESPAASHATEARSNFRRPLPPATDTPDSWPRILQARTKQQTMGEANVLDGVPAVPPRTPRKIETPRNGTRGDPTVYYNPQPAHGPASSKEHASSQVAGLGAQNAEGVVARVDPSLAFRSPHQGLQGSIMRMQPDAMSRADDPAFPSPRSLEAFLHSRSPRGESKGFYPR
jgi:hypothetical protein